MSKTYKEWQEYYKNASKEDLIEEITRDGEHIEDLERQLSYLRSGEYITQLRFERDMLEELIQEEKLSIEVYDIKKMARKNTELAEKIEKITKYMKKDVEEELKYLYKKNDEFFKEKDFGDKGYGCAIQCVQAIQDHILEILENK